MSNSPTLYTQKDLVDIIGMPRQTLSRYLPVDGYFLLNGENNIKVKAYPLSALPADMRNAVVAAELEALPEPHPAMLQNTEQLPLKAWQTEIREARLALLQHVQDMTRLMNLQKAEKTLAAMSKAGTLPEHLAILVEKATARKYGGVSYSTLRRWRALLQTEGIDALTPESGPSPHMPGWLPIFLEAYRVPGRPSIRQIYNRLLDEGEQLPCLRTVQNWVNRLGKIESNKGRLGMLELKKYRVHSMRTFEDLKPTDVYTADGHTAKFFVQHPFTGKPFKPELVVVVDVATRAVVGFNVGLAESAIVTMEALHSAFKRAGVPAVFYTDNGSGYKNQWVDDKFNGLMARFGITKKYSLPRRAWSRGLIERMQDTLWVKNARELPAYAGKDSDRDQQKQLITRINRDLTERGTSQLLMTWTQFLEWCENCIGHYNNQPHSSLPQVFDSRLNKMRHETPMERFARMVDKKEIVKPDTTMLEEMMRPHTTRKALHGWVSLHNNKYYHAALESYHGMDVTVAFDIKDPEYVWIKNAHGQLVCKAKLNGNTHGYFPKSFIEQCRDKRKKAQDKRLDLKRADNELERKGQEALEISPQKAAAILEFQESWENAKPQLAIPEDDCEKYELWQELNARTDTLTEREQEFLEQYPKSSSFAVGKKRAADIEDFMRRVS